MTHNRRSSDPRPDWPYAVAMIFGGLVFVGLFYAFAVLALSLDRAEIVPCTTDTECLELNPNVEPY